MYLGPSQEVEVGDQRVLEKKTDPSIFKIIRSPEALARMLPTLDLSCEENAARRKVGLLLPDSPILLYFFKKWQFFFSIRVLGLCSANSVSPQHLLLRRLGTTEA